MNNQERLQSRIEPIKILSMERINYCWTLELQNPAQKQRNRVTPARLVGRLESDQSLDIAADFIKSNYKE